ncbi:alpha/beta fold hydrolase [Nocardiopsis sinuspersici]|uniref:alpha/beta fold hydrolase n=1 Tax=Nocardiopsis sinuspersici TaxID=501010 RepID=UPI0015CEA563|nr:alpha/beta hydrolase [Nocardiopsis sinuspersici]
MLTQVPVYGHVYRSRPGETAVRSWCERELAGGPGTRSPYDLTADGRPTRVHVLEGGPGTPVLVLSGAVLSSAALTGLARLVRADRTVILADMPGQPGLSCSRRVSGRRPAAYGAWLDALLPQVTDRPVVLLGHSLGAVAALSSLPSPLVKGMLLVGPAGLADPVLGLERLLATCTWRFSPGERTSLRLLDALCGPRGAGPGPGPHPLEEWMTLVGRHCRVGSLPGMLRGEEFGDWRGTPVTVATGSHDRVFSPALLHGAARRLLDTGVHVVEGAGHLVPYEAPHRVRELLRLVS